MQTHNRAGRFTARLGLESLENRTLLSATLPTPSSTLGAVANASSIQVQHQTTTTTHIQTAAYSYHWSITPSAVLTGTNSATGNGRSTGCVMVALYRPGNVTGKVGGPANALSVALVTSSSSASPSRPDHFNTSFSISLTIKDSASGASGKVTFTGTIKGTLTWSGSALTLSFTGGLTRQIKLGKHLYTVTLKTGSLHVPLPGAPAPALIGATVAVANAPTPKR
jgi:hypothetical protein